LHSRRQRASELGGVFILDTRSSYESEPCPQARRAQAVRTVPVRAAARGLPLSEHALGIAVQTAKAAAGVAIDLHGSHLTRAFGRRARRGLPINVSALSIQWQGLVPAFNGAEQPSRPLRRRQRYMRSRLSTAPSSLHTMVSVFFVEIGVPAFSAFNGAELPPPSDHMRGAPILLVSAFQTGAELPPQNLLCTRFFVGAGLDLSQAAGVH
jgi:hypothetical protein